MLKPIPIENIRRLQLFLSKKVVKEDKLPPRIQYIAGIDVAHTPKVAIAATSVLSYPELQVVEENVACVRCEFPYIPTLLSFREGPAICKVIDKLEITPDVYLIDGHGIAHPFHCGLATHVGVLMGIPTIGVAKGLLYGEVGESKGAWAPIKEDETIIGVAIFTGNRKPIYVSIGNMISLERAIEIVLTCLKGERVPKPIIMAHMKANREKEDLRL